MSENYFITRTECPTCRSKSLSEIYSLPYSDENIEDYLMKFYNSQGKVELEYLANNFYTLIECKDCDLIFQKEIPGDELMFKLYEEWIDPDIALQRSFDHDINYHMKNAYEIIDLIQYFGTKPNQLQFLDFGMGWSKWCILSKAFEVNTFGMELSEKRIAHAQKNGIGVITWDDLPAMSLDYINTEQVFEHIPNPIETLQHLVTGLKVGGIIKISVPNGLNAKNVVAKMNWTTQKDSPDSNNIVAPLEHINCYKTSTIIKLASICGLEHVQGIRKARLERNSLKESVKDRIRPFYSALKKTKNTDTSLFFKKV